MDHLTVEKVITTVVSIISSDGIVPVPIRPVAGGGIVPFSIFVVGRPR